jgi:hypothetical protein
MFVNVGLDALLTRTLDDPAVALTYHLFKNDETVVVGSVLGDFDESDFTGYAAKDSESEPAPTVNGSNEANSQGDELTWTKTGSPETVQQVYGVYVTIEDLDTDPVLLAAWNLPAPVAISVAGNMVKVTVDWYAKNYNP